LKERAVAYCTREDTPTCKNWSTGIVLFWKKK